ncbi:MAG: alpha/beta hydrolase [Acidobacteria bacterium]|nr:alpha/beta hydrolase [Acidobacteriota bacterium]|tara:strand:+ start:7207 stop:8214 length:1008 start_codon:yes stop_codon:yes gene_type:complete
MIARFFHAWEHRLVAIDTNRIIRPFEWGLDWLKAPADSATAPANWIEQWATTALSDPTWFDPGPCEGYTFKNSQLAFPSALETPHRENNTVHARYFPAKQGGHERRATLVLPQWNADSGGHIGLCQLLARLGISALRLSLPYHDKRMPPELSRADFIVSSNIGRTLQVNRQAVLDARRAIAWLASRGYNKIGILGTSLGSCLAALTTAHEPLIKTAALNHISPYFADVVWEGLSTAHVRAGLEGKIALDLLRRLWLPISPYPYIEKLRNIHALLVYARYDLSFPVRLSRQLITEFERLGIRHQVTVLPCGHYTTGKAPFSWLDGYTLVQFLRRYL